MAQLLLRNGCFLLDRLGRGLSEGLLFAQAKSCMHRICIESMLIAGGLAVSATAHLHNVLGSDFKFFLLSAALCGVKESATGTVDVDRQDVGHLPAPSLQKPFPNIFWNPSGTAPQCINCEIDFAIELAAGEPDIPSHWAFSITCTPAGLQV